MFFGSSNEWQHAPILNVSGRYASSTPGQLTLSACDNGVISFSTHTTLGVGVEHARINSLGYLGIKNTNPSVELDVTGSAKVSGSFQLGSSTYTNAILNAWSNTAYTASNTAGYSSNYINILTLQGNDTSNKAFFTSNLAVTTSNNLYQIAGLANSTAFLHLIWLSMHQTRS